MTFIFIAAILVRNMDGFSPTQSFLSAPTPTINGTISNEGDGSNDEDSYDEVYLLISILCYNSFSAFGVMILPWTLISELYPIQVSDGKYYFNINSAVETSNVDSPFVNR